MNQIVCLAPADLMVALSANHDAPYNPNTFHIDVRVTVPERLQYLAAHYPTRSDNVQIIEVLVWLNPQTNGIEVWAEGAPLGVLTTARYTMVFRNIRRATTVMEIQPTTCRIALPPVHHLGPANQLPTGKHVLLPRGYLLSATTRAQPPTILYTYLPENGATEVFVTLHPAGDTGGIEIRLDNQVIGELTFAAAVQIENTVVAYHHNQSTATCMAVIRRTGNEFTINVDVASNLSEDDADITTNTQTTNGVTTTITQVGDSITWSQQTRHMKYRGFQRSYTPPPAVAFVLHLIQNFVRVLIPLFVISFVGRGFIRQAFASAGQSAWLIWLGLFVVVVLGAVLIVVQTVRQHRRTQRDEDI